MLSPRSCPPDVRRVYPEQSEGLRMTPIIYLETEHYCSVTALLMDCIFYARLSPRACHRRVEGSIKTDSSTPLRSARNDNPSNHA